MYSVRGTAAALATAAVTTAPAGAGDQLAAALGAEFHRDFGPVLRGMLFAFDRDHVTTSTGPGTP
jgi:hypothetical protein